MKDVKIVMQDVPSAPLDVNVTDVFQTNCKVSWKPPKDDGGSPLLHYAVERQDISLKGNTKFSKINLFSIMVVKFYFAPTYLSVEYQIPSITVQF